MIEQGRIVQIEWGKYSGHIVAGYFRVLKPFDPHEKLATHVEERRKEREETFKDAPPKFAFESAELLSEYGLVHEGNFVRELESGGYIVHIPCDTWHISSYGKPSEMVYEKNDKCNPGEI